MTWPFRRPRPAAAIAAAAAFALLAGLGTWQLQRLSWKLGLLHRIETRLAEAPVPLPAAGIVPDDWQYRRVFVDGRFDHAKEIHLYAASKRGEPGFLIFTPLERPDGSTVFVDRGWVPTERKDAKTRAEGQVAGPVHVVGIVRLPWPRHPFVAQNLPGENLWFYGDIDAMARQAGVTRYAPVFVDADATPNPGGLPEGGQTRVNVPNDHLQYALTWFGLAAVLLVMFGYAHLRREETDGPPAQVPPRA